MGNFRRDPFGRHSSPDVCGAHAQSSVSHAEDLQQEVREGRLAKHQGVKQKHQLNKQDDIISQQRLQIEALQKKLQQQEQAAKAQLLYVRDTYVAKLAKSKQETLTKIAKVNADAADGDRQHAVWQAEAAAQQAEAVQLIEDCHTMLDAHIAAVNIHNEEMAVCQRSMQLAMAEQHVSLLHMSAQLDHAGTDLQHIHQQHIRNLDELNVNRFQLGRLRAELRAAHQQMLTSLDLSAQELQMIQDSKQAQAALEAQGKSPEFLQQFIAAISEKGTLPLDSLQFILIHTAVQNLQCSHTSQYRYPDMLFRFFGGILLSRGGHSTLQMLRGPMGSGVHGLGGGASADIAGRFNMLAVPSVQAIETWVSKHMKTHLTAKTGINHQASLDFAEYLAETHQISAALGQDATNVLEMLAMTKDGTFVGDIEERISSSEPTPAEHSNQTFKDLLEVTDCVSSDTAQLDDQLAAAAKLLEFFDRVLIDLAKAKDAHARERAAKLQTYLQRRSVDNEHHLHPAQRKQLIQMDEDQTQKAVLLVHVQVCLHAFWWLS